MDGTAFLAGNVMLELLLLLVLARSRGGDMRRLFSFVGMGRSILMFGTAADTGRVSALSLRA